MGGSGSGKTTFTARIAERRGVPHTELDAVHWLPNWTMPELDEYRQRVSAIVAADAWVLDGNYGKVRDVVWLRADTVVFLDYPLWLSFGRLLWRTVTRSFMGTELWAGNRESIRRALLDRDSILLYALSTYRRRRRSLFAARENSDFEHIQFIFFRWPRQAERWLATLKPL
jgi:adenylate kinase family enzyme